MSMPSQTKAPQTQQIPLGTNPSNPEPKVPPEILRSPQRLALFTALSGIAMSFVLYLLLKNYTLTAEWALAIGCGWTTVWVLLVYRFTLHNLAWFVVQIQSLRNQQQSLRTEILDLNDLQVQWNYRLRFETLLTTTSTKLINLNPLEVEREIQIMLPPIAEFLNVDFCHLAFVPSDFFPDPYTFHWLNPSLEIQDTLKSECANISLELQKVDVLNIPHVAALGVEQEKLKRVFGAGQIESWVSITLKVQGLNIGCFGLGTIKRKNDWAVKTKTITMLKIIGEMFTNALLRKQAENNLLHKLRMENELKTAAAVQRTLFPKEMPDCPEMDLASAYQLASETGGDWFGFMRGAHRQFYILIGDVTGHGTPAALIAAGIHSACNVIQNDIQTRKHNITPSNLMGIFNNLIYKTGYPDFLMTFFIASIDLDSGMMEYCNAGHNFPLVFKSTHEFRHLLNCNQRLGAKADLVFSQGQKQLENGDSIIFFTDGIIENCNPLGLPFSEKSLIRSWKKVSSLKMKDKINDLMTDFHEHIQNRALDDDVTVVACQFKQALV